MPIKIVNTTGESKDTRIILEDKNGVQADITEAGEAFDIQINIPGDSSIIEIIRSKKILVEKDDIEIATGKNNFFQFLNRKG